MTNEGVKGAEYYTFRESKSPNSVHNCTLPFTRNVVGSMDYTTTTFTIRKENPRTTTYAHELALAFVFESGWVCMADRPDAYLNSPAKPILQRVEAAWDETKLIDGYPGEYVVIARRKGDTWYLSGINALKARTVSIPLDFLKNGKYKFDVYTDHEVNPMTDIKIVNYELQNTDVLTVELIPNGGFATVIEQKLN